MANEFDLHHKLMRLCVTGARIDSIYAAQQVIEAVREYDAEHDVHDVVFIGEPKSRRRVKTKVGQVRKGEPILWPGDFEDLG